MHLDAVIEIKKDVIAVKNKVENLSKVVKGKIKQVKKAEIKLEDEKSLKEEENE